MPMKRYSVVVVLGIKKEKEKKTHFSRMPNAYYSRQYYYVRRQRLRWQTRALEHTRIGRPHCEIVNYQLCLFLSLPNPTALVWALWAEIICKSFERSSKSYLGVHGPRLSLSLSIQPAPDTKPEQDMATTLRSDTLSVVRAHTDDGIIQFFLWH